MLVQKYTRAKSEALHLGFMDLTSAFDKVNRSKLWALMLELGVPTEIVVFLRELHADMNGVVRIDQEGRQRGLLKLVRVFARVVF